MTGSDVYLLCFAFGFLWSAAALLLGSFHLHGHAHSAHLHHPGAHGTHGSPKAIAVSKVWSEFFNVHSLAIFLAWFGGCGFLMSRHSTFGIPAVLLISVVAGLGSALLLAAFLRFLHARERILDPFDYEMVGVLGHVACAISNGGTGEILFTRDGARKSSAARSDDGKPIERGVEVIVTRYEKGIAYVRTWDSMTKSDEGERDSICRKK